MTKDERQILESWIQQAYKWLGNPHDWDYDRSGIILAQGVLDRIDALKQAMLSRGRA